MDALDNRDSLGAKWTRWALFGSTNISFERSNKSLLKIFSSLQFVFADIIGTNQCPTFNVQVASKERWSRGRHCEVRWCLGCRASGQGCSHWRLWACDEVQSQTQVRRAFAKLKVILIQSNIQCCRCQAEAPFHVP